jgi:hypothetical protein
MISIDPDVSDEFYRYKMERISVVVRKNTTEIVNLKSIATALRRPEKCKQMRSLLTMF